MTSQWLQDHVSTTSPQPLLSPCTVNQNYAQIIEVPLFQREELLSNDITVTITIHLEDPPAIDSDFFTAVCDDTVCTGMSISDSWNYLNNACTYVTMKCSLHKGTTLMQILPLCHLHLVAASRSYTCAQDGLDTVQLALVVFFLPPTSENTPLAVIVVITCCNLRWWCFSLEH